MSPSFRRWLGRRGTPHDEASPDDRRAAAREGTQPIAELADRHKVAVVGTIASLGVTSRHTANWLEAVLDDGTGTLTLIWMGRTAIPGVDSGRLMRVEGRVSSGLGGRRIYNPLYTLL